MKGYTHRKALIEESPKLSINNITPYISLKTHRWSKFEHGHLFYAVV